MYQYELLFDTYNADKKLIPEGNLFEVSFNQLDTNPIDTIKKIYEHFNWKDFDSLEPIVEDYTQSLKDFKKNDLRQLPEKWKTIVYDRWVKSFQEFGYEK